MKQKTGIFLCLLALIAFAGCSFRSTDIKEAKTQKCSVAVLCDEALKKPELLGEEKAALLPENGELLNLPQVEFKDGETAFSILLHQLQTKKIHYDYETLAGTNIRYISAVGNLYEFDCGPTSGWIYTVNGAYPDCSADAYEVKDGDKIEWKYITEFESES